MTKLETHEKINLLRYHGECLSRAFISGIGSPSRPDLIQNAERALEIIKSIPKVHFADTEK